MNRPVILNEGTEHEVPTPERHVLRLNSEWALGQDEVQWIVYRWRGPKQGWRPVSFVATSKVVLRRVLDELGIQPTPEAKAAFDHLLPTFKEWLNARKGEWNDV